MQEQAWRAAEDDGQHEDEGDYDQQEYWLSRGEEEDVEEGAREPEPDELSEHEYIEGWEDERPIEIQCTRDAPGKRRRLYTGVRWDPTPLKRMKRQLDDDRWRREARWLGSVT